MKDEILILVLTSILNLLTELAKIHYRNHLNKKTKKKRRTGRHH